VGAPEKVRKHLCERLAFEIKIGSSIAHRGLEARMVVRFDVKVAFADEPALWRSTIG
jgi:hypothetical protein